MFVIVVMCSDCLGVFMLCDVYWLLYLCYMLFVVLLSEYCVCVVLWFLVVRCVLYVCYVCYMYE